MRHQSTKYFNQTKEYHSFQYLISHSPKLLYSVTKQFFAIQEKLSSFLPLIRPPWIYARFHRQWSQLTAFLLMEIKLPSDVVLESKDIITVFYEWRLISRRCGENLISHRGRENTQIISYSLTISEEKHTFYFSMLY